MADKSIQSPKQKRLDRWLPNRPVSAAKLTEGVEAINEINRKIAFPRQIKGEPRSGRITHRRYSIVESLDDHLKAREILAGGVLSNITELIAKDWWNQRTPFDGETFNGKTYTYTSADERTGDNGSGTTEVQVIVPPYVATAEILVIRMPQGTGVTVAVDGVDTELTLMEANGQRSWAKKNE